MSNYLEQFTALKRLRDRLAKCEWSCRADSVRIFYPGHPTSEMTVDEKIMKIVGEALGLCERDNCGRITFSGHEALGSALRRIVLHDLDQKLLEMGKRAKAEAEACLKMVEGQPQ